MCSRSQQGQALIDVIIGTAIIGLTAGPMFGALVNLLRQSAESAKRIQAVWVANSIMEEITTYPFEDPDGATDTFGPDGTAEEENGRSHYDDVDDFNGYSYSPSFYGLEANVAVSGAEITTSDGTRSISVGESFTDYKQVQVTVTGSGIQPADGVVLKTLIANRAEARPAPPAPVSREALPALDFVAASGAGDESLDGTAAIRFSEPLTRVTLVNFAFNFGFGGSAGEADYTTIFEPILFLPGDQDGLISWPVIDDGEDEPGGETITLEIQGGDGFTVGSTQPTFTYTIEDNDGFLQPPASLTGTSMGIASDIDYNIPQGRIWFIGGAGCNSRSFSLPSGEWTVGGASRCLERVMETTIQQINFNMPKQSHSNGFPGITDRTDNYAVQFTGEINLSTEGNWGFQTTSDDGSNFYLYLESDGGGYFRPATTPTASNQVRIVNNDGRHAMQSRQGSKNLRAASYKFRLDYFQGPPTKIGLQLWWKQPGSSSYTIIPSIHVGGASNLGLERWVP